MATQEPEPWLRGTHRELPSVQRAVVHALEQAREDVLEWCGRLREDEIEARPAGLPSAGFQMRHLARSLDRLRTYADGGALSGAQFAALESEIAGDGRAEVFAEVESSIAETIAWVRAVPVVDLNLERGVGRAGLPTTVGGLIVHMAEHTQRHVGQAITTAKIVLAARMVA